MIQRLLVLGFAALACVQPGRPVALARADHALFWNAAGVEIPLALAAEGASWSSGEVDPVLHPRLAEAWERGEAPASPLIGRDPGLWLRAVDLTPPPQPDGAWTLRARALAPFPVRLSVQVERDGALEPVAAAESAVWNRYTHFASVEAPALLDPGALLCVRVEGRFQAFETRLRLTR